jgi:hypothetical protein
MLSRLFHTLRHTSHTDLTEPDAAAVQADLQRPLLASAASPAASESGAWPAPQGAQGSVGSSPSGSLNMSEIWYSGAPEAAHTAVTVAPACPNETGQAFPQRRWPWSQTAASQAAARSSRPDNKLPEAGLFTLLDADLEAGGLPPEPLGHPVPLRPPAPPGHSAPMDRPTPERLPLPLPLAQLSHHASLARSACGTEAVQLRPMQRPREIVGAFCGGLIGVVFGLQYTGFRSPQLQGPTEGAPWRMFVYPPFYGLVTAVSIMAMIQWLSGDWQHPANTLFLLTSERVEALQTPSLARKLRHRELAGAALGAALGLVCGMQYAYEHGGTWRYYIFPQWLALNMILPSLAMTRWLVMPPVHNALRQVPSEQSLRRGGSLAKVLSLRGRDLEPV